ncbi:uncharacterized protein PAC_13676 [Phialocephala subalpina]|uniref:Zn(2)-C6 fungal-type domain-containing protein n=1 Tax=Phialocephala subalpina TaxID=576137 RepID=A0A1L7XFF7_9HELO|nr:uncharacterized protein PAC_13676 [Phialocephala subalpina]
MQVLSPQVGYSLTTHSGPSIHNIASRKRKCDAKRPRCTNCVEAEADCQYDDLPVQRIEGSGSREILNRLQDIESLLERQTENVAALSAEIQSRPSRAEFAGALSATSPMSHNSHTSPNMGSPMATHSNGVGMTPRPWHQNGLRSDVAEAPPLTIPVKHNTSSSYLLCLPQMKALIGEYPNDLFFLLESRNQLPPELTFDGWDAPLSEVHINKEVTDYLVTAFFAEAYACHPILDRDTFHAIYSRFLEVGIDSGVESALCLVVFALGSAALTPQRVDGSASFGTRPPGMEYIQSALPILIALSSWSFSWNILLPQALVLASIYFAYIVRPLQSWRLIYSASTVLQFKLSRFNPQEDDASSRDTILRLFWSCFLIECDRLAELELPQSGLQQLIDETNLPDCSNLNPLESTCYLAEISIRRLLNRIHNSLYPRTSTLSSTSLSVSDVFSGRNLSTAMTICDELHRQLELWYESIPEPFRPTLEIDPLVNDRETVLRISTTKILRRPSQYTWTFSLSSLGAIVVLTLSSLCPSLKHLVPDIGELQSLVIQNIKPWASLNSSLDAIISIIQEMQRKQRLLAFV